MPAIAACRHPVDLGRRGLICTLLAAPVLTRAGIAFAAPGVAVDAAAGVKALTFDMQGTVFDFYDPLVRTAADIAGRRSLTFDYATLPGDWSNAAHAIIVDISAHRRPWISNTEVYRQTLDPLLSARGVADKLTPEDKAELLAAWGRMVPWPDSRPGITRLRGRFTCSTLTNAAMAQMTALVKTSGLPFDEVLTGELNRAFKPDPKVYQLAVDYVGFAPNELMMVSAHKWDLQASKAAGFRTAYVPRPMELGPGHAVDDKPEPFIDVRATDMVDLARKLGA